MPTVRSRRSVFSLALATAILALGPTGSARAQDYEQLERQMIEATQAGQLKVAERIARQTIDLARTQKEWRNVMVFSLKLGLMLNQRGAVRESEPVLRECVELAERGFRPNDTWTVRALQLLGASIDEQGRYADAEAVYRRGLARAEGLQPPRPDLAANLHRNIGGTSSHLGKLREAETSYRKALELIERQAGAGNDARINTTCELADFLRKLDRLDEAEALYNRALGIAEQWPEASTSVVGGPPLLAILLANVGDFYLSTARGEEAERLFRRSLDLLLRTVGPDSAYTATAHSNLGRLASERGQFDQAEREMRTALAIKEKALGPGHPDLVNTLQALAVSEIRQHHYAAAEALLRRAVAIREKAQGSDHPETARVVADLARVCRGLGRLDEADRLFLRALAAQEKSLGPENSAVGLTLYLLANMRSEQGRLDEAVALYRRALAIAEKTSGADGQLATYLRLMMASLAGSQGRNDEALPLIERVIAALERTGESASYRSTALQLRAQALWNLKRHDEAVAELRRAIDLAETQRGQYSGGGRERAEAFSGARGAFELMMLFQIKLGPEKNDSAAAFDAIERAHARALLDDFALAGTDPDAGRPPDQRDRLRAREAQLKAEVRRLERTLQRLAGPDDPAANSIQAELKKARVALYQFDRDRESSSPAYQNLLSRSVKLPPLAEIQKNLLRPGDLMLVFFLGDTAGGMLAVQRDSARLWDPMFNQNEAKVMGVDSGPLTAGRLRRALVNDKGTGVLQRLADPQAAVPAEALAVLADTVLPPDRKKALTDGSIKRLIVIPDGPLAMLPFEALVMEPGEKPRYLLDDGPAVVYAPSAAVLKNLTERTPAAPPAGREPVLALGDPAYPGADADATADSRGAAGSRSRWAAAGGKLPRLPFSGWEAEWVAKAFNDQKVPAVTLTGATATEAGVRYWSSGRRLLHLACHGLVDQELGNFFGALALAPGPRPDDSSDDGFLNLSEIHALDLKACELTVLSACETNLGPQQTGEGTWSLSRGFLVAGARRVVASNWLVDDEAAASLMSVYANLLAGGEKEGKPTDYSAALRDAKRWVRKQDKWRAPYYWASLVLIGPP